MYFYNLIYTQKWYQKSNNFPFRLFRHWYWKMNRYRSTNYALFQVRGCHKCGRVGVTTEGPEGGGFCHMNCSHCGNFLG